jgi:Rod binding domain-containing protein
MQIGALDGLVPDQDLVLDQVASKQSEDFAALLEKAQGANKQADAKTPKEDKLKEACQELCSFFVSYLLRQMRETIPESDLFPQSGAGKIYQDMLDSEIAGEIAKSGSLDLPAVLYEQLKQG